jgi:hypothetical protein
VFICEGREESLKTGKNNDSIVNFITRKNFWIRRMALE